ncbi:MAG: hypothetical protein NZM44_07415, partial [Candidatus Calescibacterium sp.]|nr:hypothetical protein [Candidatus Calescibacterium sp.]
MNTSLMKMALSRGWDFEDFFLHFKEDTYLDANSVTTDLTIFVGKGTRIIFTYNSSTNHIGGWLNASNPQDVFSFSNNGGGLWIMAPERFDEINFESLSVNGQPGQNGRLVIEYPSEVDHNFSPTNWKTLNIVEDTTNQLRQAGKIRWFPPSDWKFSIIRGNGALISHDGAGGYVIRIKTLNYQIYPKISSSPDGHYNNIPIRLKKIVDLLTTNLRVGNVIGANTTSIRINNRSYYRGRDYYKDMTIEIISGRGQGQVRKVISSETGSDPLLYISPSWDIVPNTTSIYRITGPTVRILGWDPANDRNGDGYVDDDEFANLVNPKATARFRWESRVKKGTEEWSSANASCRPNLWNPNYRQALLDYYLPIWRAEKIRGYDNDDAPALLNYSHFPVLLGGRIWEKEGGPVGLDSQLNLSYRDAFFDIHRAFKESGVEFIGTNIANTNYWEWDFHRAYIGVFNFFRQEDTTWDTMGYAGDGLSVARKAWQISGYAKAGVYSLIQGQKNRFGGVINDLKGTKEAWEWATVAQLAQYYLLNIPDKTFFQFWNCTFWYGSWLTSQSENSCWDAYYKSGVPKNIAYPPHLMLRVDIGQPANRIPPGYEAIQYVGAVGRSNDDFVILTSNNLKIDVYPTYIYYLWKSTSTWSGLPFESVLAREYTKGLVIYRAPFASWLFPANMTRLDYISSSNALTVTLPGLYRKVNYDGTLGPVTDKITLRGFEGAILVKAEHYPPDRDTITNIKDYLKIFLFSDNYSPQPGDIITYRAVLRNISTTTLVRTRFSFPLTTLINQNQK